MPPTIYFDLDGVFANFDKAAAAVLGTSNIYKFEFVYGASAFWQALDAHPDFFGSMEVMPGSLRMLGVLKSELSVTILTSLPKSSPALVDRSKRRWVAENISNRTKVITCLTREKPDYCQIGDVLIDDRAVNKAAWEAKGGRYIVHTDVGSTISQLESMGLTK